MEYFLIIAVNKLHDNGFGTKTSTPVSIHENNLVSRHFDLYRHSVQ